MLLMGSGALMKIRNQLAFNILKIAFAKFVAPLGVHSDMITHRASLEPPQNYAQQVNGITSVYVWADRGMLPVHTV
jgi:hypothetical protein